MAGVGEEADPTKHTPEIRVPRPYRLYNLQVLPDAPAIPASQDIQSCKLCGS